MAESPQFKKKLREALNQCAQGESNSFQDVYTLMYRRLVRFFINNKVIRSDAQDLAQETLLKLWQVMQQGKYDFSKNNDSGFIFTIGSNKMRDLWRKKSRCRTEALDFEDHDGEGDSIQIADTRELNPASAVVSDDTYGEIVRILNEFLTEDDVRAFLDIAEEERSYGEIAAERGRPVGTLKSRMHAARIKLRENLDLQDLRAA